MPDLGLCREGSRRRNQLTPFGVFCCIFFRERKRKYPIHLLFKLSTEIIHTFTLLQRTRQLQGHSRLREREGGRKTGVWRETDRWTLEEMGTDPHRGRRLREAGPEGPLGTLRRSGESLGRPGGGPARLAAPGGVTVAGVARWVSAQGRPQGTPLEGGRQP